MGAESPPHPNRVCRAFRITGRSPILEDFRLELADDADGVEHVGGVALGEVVEEAALEVDDAAAEAGGEAGGAGQGGEEDRIVRQTPSGAWRISVAENGSGSLRSLGRSSFRTGMAN